MIRRRAIAESAIRQRIERGAVRVPALANGGGIEPQTGEHAAERVHAERVEGVGGHAADADESQVDQGLSLRADVGREGKGRHGCEV